MPYNGAGLFQRARSWVADAAAGLAILPNLMDQDANDIALGLNNCITRDGQGGPTADIPWNGKGITGLRAPKNAGDALSLGTTPASEINRALGFNVSQSQTASTAQGSVADFSQNGAYIEPLAVAFTAAGNSAVVVAGITLNHQNAIATTFRGYVDLFDNNAGAQAAQGMPFVVQLASGSISIGSLFPFLSASGLTVGHGYVARLFIQRDGAVGPTSYSCRLDVLNA